MTRQRYIVVDGEGNIVEAEGLLDALRKAASLKPPVRLYRAVPVAVLDEEELEELRGLLQRQPSGESGGHRRGAKLAIVVFDQMFRGFGEIIGRELGGAVEVHEIAGRGLDKPVKSGSVILEPAHDDYDILKLLEKLRTRKLPVIFFTGDKRLAQQASMIEGVYVEYLPPSEVPGKEVAIRRMLEKIRGIVEEVWA